MFFHLTEPNYSHRMNPGVFSLGCGCFWGKEAYLAPGPEDVDGTGFEVDWTTAEVAAAASAEL